MNYVIVVHPVVFLSPLWHPTSLMVFLYFVRNEPLVALVRTCVNDRTILIALSMVTLVLLLRTKATSDVLISRLVGLRMVLIHAALLRTEDLVLKEEAAGSETWYAAVPQSQPISAAFTDAANPNRPAIAE
ncbi:unnamed protein product [Musa acuminata subsp. malaccensis]|nr:unnamed protein product [Musa acuminata subsp. malaccensis]